MTAYVISDLEMLEPALVAEYRALAQATIAQYGGRYLARDGAVQPVEGGWTPQHIVILEFPTMEQARTWYHSPEYAVALKVREKALRRRLIFVEGADATAPG